MKDVIEVSALGITRGNQTILSDVSFSLKENERLAIIGPNGAGKSFLLRVLSADLVPSSGKVTILGQTFGKVSLWDLRQKIGFVSTRMAYQCERSLSGIDVVCSGFKGTYSLAEDPTKEQLERAKEIMGMFGLQTTVDRKFSKLSDGESRRTLLCRALVNKPELLILDEPCQGLDVNFRDVLLEDINQLSKSIPLVYVTHHLQELPSCITHIMFIKGGVITGIGVKDKLLTSEKVSELFDCPLQVRKKGNRYYLEHDE